IHLIAHEESISPSGESGDIALPTVELPGPVAVQGDIPLESAAAMVTSLVAGTEIDARRQVAEETARRATAALPTVGTVTCESGRRGGAGPDAIDIANVIGTPLVPATDGTVSDAGRAQGFGNWVQLLSDEGTMTVYGHMEEVLVSTSQR